MAPRSARVLTLVLVSGLAVGAALFLFSRDGSGELGFHAVDRAAQERVEERLASLRPAARARLSAEAGDTADPGAPRLLRLPLDEEAVRVLQPLKGAKRRYDPFCYFTWKPDLAWTRKWPEHPGGRYAVATNSLGLRRDGELLAAVDARVLVAGDSHIDGVCANAESLPGRLEAALRERHPGRTIEVANAAHGAYTFYHYLGALERFLDLGLAPDVFVVVVYGGNDFVAGVHLWHVFEGTDRPRRSRDYEALVGRVARDHGPAFGQVLNQVESLKTRPGEVELSLTMGLAATHEIQRTCAANDIELIVAYLPSPHEVPDQAPTAPLAAGAGALELVDADFARSTELAERYLAGTRASGVSVLDLREAFRAHAGLLYWVRDLHLNLDGHELAARALLPLVESRLSTSKR